VARKLRGAWYTPPALVDVVVDHLIGDLPDRDAREPVRVLDPACGDGRFLHAVRSRLEARGRPAELSGCDIDADALAATGPGVRTICADALHHDWGGERFDIVIGNPPFLSQMAAATTRGGSSRHGGGPYAGAAVEFLALAVGLADPRHGRVGLVLPQSVLAARDTNPVREQIARDADLAWSWWDPEQRHFDANVNVCALGFRRPATGATDSYSWTAVVTKRLGVPAVDDLTTDGTLGERAELNANFRDEYYALVSAVSDDAHGPPLVTSGLIDPGACRWGRRTVRFAKRDFAAPRVDLDALEGRFAAWAARKLVPKVLVANQTRVIEAVADPAGAWLPGVPVTTATPTADATVWQIAAVLTSPVASATAWHLGAGTGLSTTALRIGPALLAALPWPAGSLDGAVAALRAGDVVACAERVDAAYGMTGPAAANLLSWWYERLPAGSSAPGR
jgi:SAM-dependent methyltransferase